VHAAPTAIGASRIIAVQAALPHIVHGVVRGAYRQRNGNATATQRQRQRQRNGKATQRNPTQRNATQRQPENHQG
jgi:hypothetical protein